MTEFNALGSLEAVEECTEIRWPVAYSHGGFAQMRQLEINAHFDPLGPIPVPAAGAADVPPEPRPYGMR